tara:strand:+ start:1602 stop:2804 length:1203 start_codon:yes stop_codon:yes gene_type:complete
MTTLNASSSVTTRPPARIVNSEYSQEFLDSIKVLSDHPIYRVPVRNKGITAGESQRCYWNANIISQTFGGEVVYGYIIHNIDKYAASSYRLLGHGCWLTPEGRLVDVTPNEKGEEYRDFLPVDMKLVLNGRCTEQIKNLLFVGSGSAVAVDLACKTQTNNDYLKYSDLAFDEEDKTPFISKDYSEELSPNGEDPIDRWEELYKGKLVEINAFSMEFVKSLIQRSQEGKSYNEMEVLKKKNFWKNFANAMNPMIRVLDYPQVPLRIHNGICDFNDLFWEFLHKAMKDNKSVFDIAGDIDISQGMSSKGDATFSSGMLIDHTIPNKSLSTGKTIEQFLPFSLENVEFPRKKSKKRKLLQNANKYGLTLEELLLLSDPFMFPHPYIVKKTGIGTKELKFINRL